MKKVLMILLAAFVAASCCKTSQPETWEFDYPKEYLCGGAWSTTYYFLPNGSAALCSSPEHAYAEYRFTIKFNEDGSYRSTGFLGAGAGTYKAYGKTVEAVTKEKDSLCFVFSDVAGDSAVVTVVKSPGGSTWRWAISK